VKAYFIRKATSRETVGLFVAPSLVALAGVVDECCDPTLCEYAPAQTGGLMAADVTASTWPRPAGEAATGLEDAVLSQQWEDDLGAIDSTLQWKPLAPAAWRLLKTLTPAVEGTEPSELMDSENSPE
jgi:hypothetical protein